jgi:hypothetical protein
MLLAPLVALAAACGSPARDPLVRAAESDAGGVDAGVDAATPADAGIDADLGGPCTDDGQCDDGVACSFDACDPDRHRCRHTPDDSRCDDGVYCNGREVCVVALGCRGGAVVTCEDGDACSIDRCVEASRACTHALRDADGDGDPDAHCSAGHDCDDRDPTVSSARAEVCANGKDDDCDGAIDEDPCVTSSADTCATARVVTAPGTYALPTAGARKDYAASCGVSLASAARDVVLQIVVPPGPARDLDVWATTTAGEVSVALQRTCGDSTSEVACGPGASTSRSRGRSLAPGTYTAIVTSETEAVVEVEVDMPDATAAPANEACNAPAAITPDVAFDVALVDARKDLPGACAAAEGELTYALTLAQPADVRVFASTRRGAGAPVVGLRSTHCTDANDELRCRDATTGPLFARGLPAGTYVVTVAATAAIDASVLVKTYAPTATPPGQTCAAPPPIAADVETAIDLAGQEDAIEDGCLPGSPNGAFALALPSPSDVLLVGRFAQGDTGAVSLDTPACTAATRLACAPGATPLRASKRGVAAGEYRVVVTSSIGAAAKVTAFVRPASAPVVVTGADTCATAIDVPDGGAFFTGDTSASTADFDDGCDAPTAPGGAPDQVLRLVLAGPRHVILDMEGSTYTTILDVRKGLTCPGTSVPGACFVGFGGARSFLDLTLDAGTYWLVIDGYANDKGPWNLDVRVLPLP